MDNNQTVDVAGKLGSTFGAIVGIGIIAFACYWSAVGLELDPLRTVAIAMGCGWFINELRQIWRSKDNG